MKKKKKQIDVFETKRWMNKIVTDPYQLIGEVFFCCDMFSLRERIDKIMEYGQELKVYNERCPADIILDQRAFHSAIIAASYLREIKKSIITVTENDLFENKYFVSGQLFHDEWTDFPRNLTKEEYCNPYSVLRSFFKYQTLPQWLNIWQDRVDAALCPEDSGTFVNDFRVLKYLSKLVEALHLINVREVHHLNGRLK